MCTSYARLLAHAHDPSHPAHAYFRERTAECEAYGTAAIVGAQAVGEMRADLGPAWMVDPSIDMAADIESFLRLLRTEPEGSKAASL